MPAPVTSLTHARTWLGTVALRSSSGSDDDGRWFGWLAVTTTIFAEVAFLLLSSGA